MKIFRYCIVFIGLVYYTNLNAERYLCEIGPIAGGSYYVGDATPTVFMHIQPAYGAVFRYKFDARWALAAQGLHTDVMFLYRNADYQSDVTSIDLTGEFNFFKMERSSYDLKAKTYSPYLGLGFGAAMYSRHNNVGVYLPLSVGFKWNVLPLVNLHIEWQHQFYLFDNIEGVDELNNSYRLNGSNFLRNDMISTFTLGLTVNFWKEQKVCRMCNRY